DPAGSAAVADPAGSAAVADPAGSAAVADPATGQARPSGRAARELVIQGFVITNCLLLSAAAFSYRRRAWRPARRPRRGLAAGAPAGRRPGDRWRSWTDLLRYGPVARAARSRWYPGVARVPVAAGFGLVAYELLRGPRTASANPGSMLMWLLWWPALPVLLLLTGRFWCAVCPFGTISDVVHRVVGVESGVPRLLRTAGVWVVDAQFLAITWADHVWGIVGSPWGSAVLLMALTSAVVVSGAFLPRRAFCRYLCFLGGLCGNYARAGIVELRTHRAGCRGCIGSAPCCHGTAAVAGCPLFAVPPAGDTAGVCALCGQCLRTCPRDAIGVHLRPPFAGLWSVRRPQLEQSVLAMGIMGVVLVQNLCEVPGWRSWLTRTSAALGWPVLAVFTVTFAVTISLPVVLLVAASAVMGRTAGGGIRVHLTRFGYALIPLDVAAFVAHTQADALGHGRDLYRSVARLVGAHPTAVAPALAAPGTIRTVQWCLIIAGTAAALYVTWRILGRRYRAGRQRRAGLLTFGSLVVLLAALNLALFAVPAPA
ncbi:MAG TPA: 4Fe-4S binding protein, partial [Kineosporiaceae bacterium]